MAGEVLGVRCSGMAHALRGLICPGPRVARLRKYLCLNVRSTVRRDALRTASVTVVSSDASVIRGSMALTAA